MVILDTDHVSLLDWSGSPQALRLRMRLEGVRTDDVATTIITYEEQMRGWMAYLRKARGLDRQIDAYSRLSQHLERYRKIKVLNFDKNAATEYEELLRSRIRIGTMDLKIAAVVLSVGATLLTCNEQDSSKVPGLRIQDWTK